jgi:flavin reductase (DIM6/NTAB) family NADH-FMN oxidoreductase RutF
MFYETRLRDKTLLPHDPFKAIVTPRPIGWISTRAPDGRINLAPYSFFNGFGSVPPIVGFSSEGYKDSATFAAESGEFVANLASFDLMKPMSETSAPLPRGFNEFEHAGLTMAPCRLVKPPRVAEAHASMECKVCEVVRLKNHNGEDLENYLVIGEVVAFHIDDAYIKNGRFDTAGAKPVARCGYQDYAVVEALIELPRPAGGGDMAGRPGGRK